MPWQWALRLKCIILIASEKPLDGTLLFKLEMTCLSPDARVLFDIACMH